MVQHRKLCMVYRTAPFLIILNDLYPGFKFTPFFDAGDIRNGTTYIVFYGILIGTYTRSSDRTNSVISNDLE